MSEIVAPTPGPWIVSRGQVTGQLCVQTEAVAGGAWICGQLLNDPAEMSEAEAEANARQNAASPALVSALRLMVEKYEPVSRSLGMERAMAEARTALALAEYRPC